MNEVEKLREMVEEAWMDFEEDGSIQTYLLYQRLRQQLVAMDGRATQGAERRR